MLKGLVCNLVIFLTLIIPTAVSADTAVGIGTGKIIVNDLLMAGNTYTLPSMMVYNPGTEIGNYEMAVTFNEKQPQMKPAANWVSFSPQRFTLAPNSSHEVNITITLPAGTKSGDYYAYLEAHGIALPRTTGVTQISTAAAAKFYFSAKNDSLATPQDSTIPKKEIANDPKLPSSNILTPSQQIKPLIDQITKNMDPQ